MRITNKEMMRMTGTMNRILSWMVIWMMGVGGLMGVMWEEKGVEAETVEETVVEMRPATEVLSPLGSGPWTNHDVETTGNTGSNSCLELDRFGYAHISYIDRNTFDLKYAVWNGVQWTIETVDTGDIDGHTSLALDFTGTPHICYYNVTSGDQKYAKKTGDTWSIETVDSTGDVGRYGYIDVDSSNNPHMAYMDATNKDLKYAWWDGDSWNITALDSASVIYEYGGPSIVLDEWDVPHISYYEQYGVETGGLKYTYWNGTAWNITLVDNVGDDADYTSIALDSNNYPHIVYRDETNDNLKYAKWNGTTWGSVIVDTYGCVPTLALDSKDYAHIIYNWGHPIPNNDMRYARWNGASWNIETIGQYPGSPSIELVDDNSVQVSYHNMTVNDLQLITNMNISGDLDLSISSSDIEFSDPNPGDGEIIEIDALIHNLGDIFSEVYKVKGNGSIERAPLWSPDGAKIAYYSEPSPHASGIGGIYMMNPDGSNVKLVTAGAKVYWDSTSWSPDSQHIMYSYELGSCSHELHVVNVTSLADVQLDYSLGGEYAFPDLSADGLKLVFARQSGCSAGTFELYTSNSDGTNAVKLMTNSDPDHSARWSPEGDRMLWNWQENYTGSFDSHVWIMDSDGTNMTRLSGTPDSYLPTFSLDGSRIAYASNRDGDEDIYIIDADGGNLKQITNMASDDSYPCFSPDGSRIVFVSDSSGSKDIWMLNASATATVAFYDGNPESGGILIGSRNISVWGDNDEHVSIDWEVTGGDHDIYVRIENIMPGDVNASNNMAFKSISTDIISINSSSIGVSNSGPTIGETITITAAVETPSLEDVKLDLKFWDRDPRGNKIWHKESGIHIDTGTGYNIGDPEVIQLPNGTYRMFYTRVAAGNIEIYSSWSKNGVDWVFEKKCFSKGGNPYETWVNDGHSVIQLPNGSYRMYYRGGNYDNSWANGHILSAWSPDSYTWHKEHILLIDHDSYYDSLSAYSPNVIELQNGTYRMYYEGQNQMPPSASYILSAWSSDGMNWNKEGLCLSPGGTHDASMVRSPDVIPLSDGSFRMFYVGDNNYSAEYVSILSARSNDGLVWEKESGLRLTFSDSGYDIKGVLAPTFIISDEFSRMYYLSKDNAGDHRIQSALGQINATQIGTTQHITIPAGGSVTTDPMEWTAPPIVGTYDIYCTLENVDPTDGNLSNNIAYKTVTVDWPDPVPDLYTVPSKITFDQDVINVGDKVNISARIENIGNQSATADVEFWDSNGEPDEDTVGLWHFDDGEGSVAYDSSGMGHDGVLNNGPIWTNGKSNMGLQFDGSNDYVHVNMSGYQLYTMSFWMKPTTTIVKSMPDQTIVAFEHPAAFPVDNIGLGNATELLSDETLTIVQNSDGNTRRTGVIDLTITDEWHMITVVWNSALSRYDIYYDGEVQPVVQAPAGHAEMFDIDNLELAKGEMTLFDGEMDEVTIWNRSLSSDDVAWLFSSGIHCHLSTIPTCFPSGYPTIATTQWTPTVPGWHNITVNITNTDPAETTTCNIKATKRVYVNLQPTLEGLPDVVTNEDTAAEFRFDLDDHVTDYKDTHTYEYSGNTNIGVTIHDNNTVTFTPETDWHGSEDITFRATDSYGVWDEDTIQMTVTPVNDAPHLCHALADQYTEEDANMYWNLEGCIGDVDNLTGELTVWSNSSYEVGVPFGHVIQFYYDDEIEYENVTVYLSDGLETVSEEVTIWLNWTNDVPVISAIPNQYGLEDQQFWVSLKSYIDDPDTPDDQLELSVYSIYAEVSGLNVSFEYPDGVTYECVNISVSDGEHDVGGYFLVYITPVNDPSEWSDIPNVTAYEDIKTYLPCYPYIYDEDTTYYDMTLYCDSPYVKIDGLFASFKYPNAFNYPSGNTADDVQLWVFDGDNNVSTWVHVNVVPVDDPPVIEGVPDVNATEDVSCYLDVKPYISDVDNKKSELFIVEDSSYATVEGLVVNFTYPEGVLGENVTITVSDGHDSSNTVIHVTVTPVNDPPVLNPLNYLNTVTVTEGETVVLSPTATDVDNGQEELVFYYSGAMGGPTWDTWYTDAGVYTVTITVSDGDLSDFMNVTVVVEEAGNQDPVIEPPQLPPGVLQDDTFEYTVVASDPEGGALSFSFDEAPAGMMVDSNGKITWTPDMFQVGLHNIVLRVSDTEGGHTLLEFSLQVFNVNDDPFPSFDYAFIETGGAESATIEVWITGTKWNGLTAVILKDGEEIGNKSVDRSPGTPRDQMMSFEFTPSPGSSYTLRLTYLSGRQGATPVHINGSFGDVSFRLNRVFNNVKDASEVKVIQLTDHLYPGGVPQHQMVAFDATGSWDIDGTIIYFGWDFGDDSVAYGPVVEHLYSEPGVYTVTLTVIDDDGAIGTMNRTVEVTEGPAEDEEEDSEEELFFGQQASPYEASGVGFAAGTALGIALPWIWILLLFLLAPLMAKRSKGREDRKWRDRIDAAIKSKPGVHFRGLKVWLDVSNGPLIRNLDALIKDGKVIAKRDGLFKRYYPAEMYEDDVQPKFMSMEDKILILVEENPGAAQSELAHLLDESRQKVHYHIKKMEKTGLIHLVKEEDGHSSIYIARGRKAAEKKAALYGKTVVPTEIEDKSRPDSEKRKPKKRGKKKGRARTVPARKASGTGGSIHGKGTAGGPLSRHSDGHKRLKSGVNGKKVKKRAVAPKSATRRKVIRVSEDELSRETKSVVDAEFADISRVEGAEGVEDRMENGDL